MNEVETRFREDRDEEMMSGLAGEEENNPAGPSADPSPKGQKLLTNAPQFDGV